MWRLVFALIMAVTLCLISTSPTSAQSLADYFQISYDPESFDKTEIEGNEVSHGTIAGRATCTRDLPMNVSEASIVSQVVAIHATSGATVTLNSSYTVNIKPFPSKQGETTEISQVVPLQFPPQAESGDYEVIGKISEAKVKVGPMPIDVTAFLPQEQQMGTLKYTAPESAEIPAEQPPPPTTETSAPPAPLPATTDAINPALMPTETILPWWVWLIVAVAVATTVLNIAWFLSRRTR